MAKYNRVLPKQAAEVFATVVDRGFEPSEFEWSKLDAGPIAGSPADRLVHVPPAFWLTFEYHERWWRIKYSPGDSDTEQVSLVGAWPAALSHVGRWLGNLAEQTSFIDPWGQLTEEPSLRGSATDNSAFTVDEQLEIAAALENLKLGVRDLLDREELTEAQFEQVVHDLDELAESSSRLGRRDWRLKALGLVAYFGIDHVVGPPAGQAIWKLLAADVWPILASSVPARGV